MNSEIIRTFITLSEEKSYVKAAYSLFVTQPTVTKRIKELESEMREEGFWNDPDKAQEVTRKVKNLKDTVSAYHALELTLDDVSTMIELGNEENDASVIPEITWRI